MPETLELSVEESNALRARLGLAPLRQKDNGPSVSSNASTTTASLATTNTTTSSSGGTSSNDTVVLNMSVTDTNALRARLGLKPLQDDDNSFQHAASSASASSSAVSFVHAPAVSTKDVAARIRQAKLVRESQAATARTLATPSLGATTDGTGAMDSMAWAERLRAVSASTRTAGDGGTNTDASTTTTTNTTTKKTKKASKKKRKQQQRSVINEDTYTEQDLQGLTVGHSVGDLASGATTVLTLADASVLPGDNGDESGTITNNTGIAHQQPSLINAELTHQAKTEDGVRLRRAVEHGGDAWDDDEFAELGGTQAPSRTNRGANQNSNYSTNTAKPSQTTGFTIGAATDAANDATASSSSSLFASSMSLEPSRADVAASDYMTVEEDQQQQRNKKASFRSTSKKDKKKKKKKRHRKRSTESDNEEDDNDKSTSTNNMGVGLLEELEATAVEPTAKRRRRTSSPDGDETAPADDPMTPSATLSSTAVPSPSSSAVDKRTRYEQVMAKGNERARLAFEPTASSSSNNKYNDDEEPDDAFLNAALAKARRLNRLKVLASSAPKGTDAVVAAVQQQQQQNQPDDATTTTASHGTITFAVDETREFTRALRARTEQQGRKSAKAAVKTEAMNVEETQQPSVSTVQDETPTDNDTAMDMDLHELAKEVKNDDDNDDTALNGATGQTMHIGRGVGNILALLQQSGDMTRKNAGKEEMRGRAKDVRTYEDYEALDLDKVVRLDQRTATTKDLELAKREVKLEYRDKHGRLLTRKEAFRELSYQFHGYGQGKRKEDKKLEQIKAEQAQARVASRATAEGRLAGTFGALKATQKATGKAFVVHKTGN